MYTRVYSFVRSPFSVFTFCVQNSSNGMNITLLIVLITSKHRWSRDRYTDIGKKNIYEYSVVLVKPDCICVIN